MADDIYTIALRIDPTQANAAVRSVSSNVDTIGKGAAGIKFPFDSLVAGSSKFATGLSGITAALGPIGAALATCGISVKMFLDGIEKSDHLIDFSERIGSTVEGLQKMQYTLTHMGMSTTQAEKVLEKLASKFEELKNGEKGVTSAFGRIGISAQDINLDDFEGSLDKVRAAMKAVGLESVDTNKFLKEILGTRDALRAGDFLKTAADDIQRVTPISKETAQALKEMKEAWEDFSNSLQNSFLTGTVDLLKNLTKGAKELAQELKVVMDAGRPETTKSDPRVDQGGINIGAVTTYKQDAYVRKDTGLPDANYKPNSFLTKDSISENARRAILDKSGERPVSHDEMRLQTKEEYIKSQEQSVYDNGPSGATGQATARVKQEMEYIKQQQEAQIRAQVAAVDIQRITEETEEIKRKGDELGMNAAEKQTESFERWKKLMEEISVLEIATTTGQKARPGENKKIFSDDPMEAYIGSYEAPDEPEIPQIDKNSVSFSEALLELARKRKRLAEEDNEFKKQSLEADREAAVLQQKALTEQEKESRANEKMMRDTMQKNREEQRAHEERNRAMDEYLAQLGINEGLDLKRIRNAEKIAELATKANLKPDQVKELQDKNISNTQDLSKTPITQLVKLSLDPKSTEEVKQRAKEALDKAFEAGNVGMWDSFKVGATEALAEFSNMSKNMRSIGEQVVQGLNEGFTKFFESIITGSKNGMDAFKQLATSIISQLLAMMTQAMIVKPILEAVMGLATGGASGAAGGGGAPAGAGGNLTMNVPSGGFSYANVGHTGLVVGGGFMNTYHTGGTPDAIQVLAKRGETIVPQQDQRGRGNRGSGEGIKIINVTQNDFAEQCARNPDAILNAVGQRRKQVKNMLTQT